MPDDRQMYCTYAATSLRSPMHSTATVAVDYSPHHRQASSMSKTWKRNPVDVFLLASGLGPGRRRRCQYSKSLLPQLPFLLSARFTALSHPRLTPQAPQLKSSELGTSLRRLSAPCISSAQLSFSPHSSSLQSPPPQTKNPKSAKLTSASSSNCISPLPSHTLFPPN